jgi:CRISPR-associated protein Cmr6
MNSANLGWLFYKDYFRTVTDWENPKKFEKEIKNKVDTLIGISVSPKQTSTLGNIHFKATTTYPGLLLGSGTRHELPSVEGQAILGFDFDYTTGLPIIRGSSIKGVIRSAFPESEKKENSLKQKELEEFKLLNKMKKEYICDILNSSEKIDIDKLRDEIFKNKDIFFDATIVSSGEILADDYITPHKNAQQKKDKEGNKIADELCDPTPLRFIKVAPNVTFVFHFDLHDTTLEDGTVISKEKKRKLFEAILEDLGLGAKTNVGYGKFENFAPFVTKEEKEEAVKAQFQESFQKAKNSQEIGVLESFISQHRGTEEAAIVEEALVELKAKQKENTHKERNDKAQLAYDALLKVKGNQKKFAKEKEKFVKKWSAEKNHKKSPFVLELLEKVKTL